MTKLGGTEMHNYIVDEYNIAFTETWLCPNIMDKVNLTFIERIAILITVVLKEQ